MAAWFDGNPNEEGYRPHPQQTGVSTGGIAIVGRRASANGAAGASLPYDPAACTGQSLVWVETHEKIIERVWLHPCTPDDFSDIIEDKSTRYYTTKRMRETKKLRFVGFYQDGRGRPHDTYCNGWFPNKLAHEVKFTKLLLKFPYRIERGPEVDKVLRPDATMFPPNGQTWHLEFDTGHQRGDQISRRWTAYEPLARECEAYRTTGGKLPPMVLVVTQRRELDGLLSRAAPYAAFMHFAFYQEIMEQPFGRVIRTVGGKLGAFPKPEN